MKFWRDKVEMPTWLLFGIIACLCVTLALMWCGCAERDAQIAVQTALTISAEGVQAAGVALNEEMPDLVKRAATQAEDACPDPCSTEDFTTHLDEKLLPLSNAVKGIKLAKTSLLVAQGAQDIWVATGELPDTAPICKGVAAAVGPIPQLISDAGVKNVPEQVKALAGPAVNIGCDMIARWAKSR